MLFLPPNQQRQSTQKQQQAIISISGTYIQSDSVGGSRVLPGLLQSDGHREVVTVSDQHSEAADEKSRCCSRLNAVVVPRWGQWGTSPSKSWLAPQVVAGPQI